MQVDARRQWIDRRRMVAVADLDQAQLRIVGLLSHEFSIHREELGPGKTRGKRCDFRRGRDDIFRRWGWWLVGASAFCHKLRILSDVCCPYRVKLPQDKGKAVEFG